MFMNRHGISFDKDLEIVYIIWTSGHSSRKLRTELLATKRIINGEV